MTTPLEPDELRRRLDDAAAGPTTGGFDEVFRRAHRQRQIWRSGLVLATVVVVAAAISVPMLLVGSNNSPQGVVASPQPTTSAVSAAHTNPLALVGRWHLAAAGEAPGTSLILGEQLLLFRPCGLISGEWRADHAGLFVGDIDSGDTACFHGPQQFSAPWLDSAVGYRSVGPDRVLLNASGQVVARLSPGAHPTTGPHDASSYADAPKLTPALRASLAQPAPLPDGLSPVTPAEVLGRWVPLRATPHTPGLPYVEFTSDGNWRGSDGCNGYGGRFAVGPAGEVLTTSGGTTLIYCGGSMAPMWVVNVARAGFEGNQLVLLDASGKELGRLARQPGGHVIGRFIERGGLSPNDHPLTGEISVHRDSANGQVVADVNATRGYFEVALPVGRYVFVGSSARVPGMACHGQTGQPTSVTAGDAVQVTVVCLIK